MSSNLFPSKERTFLLTFYKRGQFEGHIIFQTENVANDVYVAAISIADPDLIQNLDWQLFMWDAVLLRWHGIGCKTEAKQLGLLDLDFKIDTA